MTNSSPPARTVLVAGGAGYIGSHTAKALSEAGFTPVAFDNLSAGFREAVRWGPLVEGDVRDEAALTRAMTHHKVEAVIHFASLIEVGRSTVRPDLFYDHNVTGTATVLRAMKSADVKRLIFSSTAAVYGQTDADLLTEDLPKDPASPYGDTKLACERMIAAHCRAFGMTAVALRYFNAAGADASGLIGEAHEPETHLIPLAIAAALGTGKALTVFGEDFPTPDGTCLRDYIHVTDLADAHLRALTADLSTGAFEIFNVGTGKGQSVRDVIEAVGRAVGTPVPYSVGGRRDGDPPRLVADPTRLMRTLGWTPRLSSIDQVVQSATAWHRAQTFRRAPAAPLT
jgi:UDP-glucose 4-epimerase/UDP-arabinose 4-epimerase